MSKHTEKEKIEGLEEAQKSQTLTWQVLVVLFCLLLWSAHFYIRSVVAAPHWATMLNNPVQAVEDTLTGCQVLANNEKVD